MLNSLLPASVHLPRIGHSSHGNDTAGTERLIRKYLSSKGVPTFMYPVTLEDLTSSITSSYTT